MIQITTSILCARDLEGRERTESKLLCVLNLIASRFLGGAGLPAAFQGGAVEVNESAGGGLPVQLALYPQAAGLAVLEAQLGGVEEEVYCGGQLAGLLLGDQEAVVAVL